MKIGGRGLAARIMWHAKTNKTLHWHVDYLCEVTDLVEVWYTADEHRSECKWASVLLEMNGIVFQERFGASDCSCRSHLFFLRRCRPAGRSGGGYGNRLPMEAGYRAWLRISSRKIRPAAERSARRIGPDGTPQ